MEYLQIFCYILEATFGKCKDFIYSFSFLAVFIYLHANKWTEETCFLRIPIGYVCHVSNEGLEYGIQKSHEYITVFWAYKAIILTWIKRISPRVGHEDSDQQEKAQIPLHDQKLGDVCEWEMPLLTACITPNRTADTERVLIDHLFKAAARWIMTDSSVFRRLKVTLYCTVPHEEQRED